MISLFDVSGPSAELAQENPPEKNKTPRVTCGCADGMGRRARLGEVQTCGVTHHRCACAAKSRPYVRTKVRLWTSEGVFDTPDGLLEPPPLDGAINKEIPASEVSLF